MYTQQQQQHVFYYYMARIHAYSSEWKTEGSENGEQKEYTQNWIELNWIESNRIKWNEMVESNQIENIIEKKTK